MQYICEGEISAIGRGKKGKGRGGERGHSRGGRDGLGNMLGRLDGFEFSLF